MKRIVRLREGRPLLDIASYGRTGPGHSHRLSSAQVEQIARTVRGVPEVMVKVSGGGKSSKAVQAHFSYIDRHGDLEIETDECEQLIGKGAAKNLIDDWDLDADAADARSPHSGRPGRKPEKLVHNIVLSMPKGTSPAGVLAASRVFAREQFGLKHRYAMVLHTDQPHPHVHLVVKAVSEHGQRLNVRKATLREWRHEFARCLREKGIEANATERAVRGATQTHNPDRIYRAEGDGRSTHLRDRVEAVAGELLKGHLHVEAGKTKLLQTRIQVEQGWRAVSDRLVSEGHSALAAEVRRFAERMPRPRTDKERIAEGLIEHVQRRRARDREQQLTR